MNERRVAIISGGCGGVGSAIGKQLAEDGFDVIALYYATPPEKAQAVIKSFAPGNHQAIHCDIRDEASVTATVKDVIAQHSRLDACIHAAVDPILRKNILEMDDAELKGQFAADFFGGFYLLKNAALAMKDTPAKGTIVGILSKVVEPETRYARMAGCTIAKYALRGLLKELHGELGKKVTVSAIAPDFMDTPLNADLPAPIRTFIAERAATGSIKSPEDAARAVSFLCSEKGETMNGKIFSFDEKEVVGL